jgi:hypothetical protein
MRRKRAKRAADTSTYPSHEQFRSRLSSLRHNAGYGFFKNSSFFRSLLEQFCELVDGHVAITENFVKQTGADGLAGVYGHNGATAIFMSEKVMAAFDAENGKAGPSEGGNNVGSGETRCPTHAAMVTRWMPTNSKS